MIGTGGPGPVSLRANSIRNGSTLPASPAVGDVFEKTGSSAGFYTCAVAGAWLGPYPTSAGSGDVVGPASATSGHLAVFSGTTGKLIADGGAVPSGITNSAPANTVTKSDGANLVASKISESLVGGVGDVEVFNAGISVNGGGGGDEIFFAENNGGSIAVRMGDFNGGVNGTSWTIDDANKLIEGFSQTESLSINGTAHTISLTAATQVSLASPDVTLNNAAYFSLAALATNGSGKIVVAASDERLKNVGNNFNAGLNEIEQITPKLFEWKDGRQQGVQAGLIAQDVQRAIPLAVSAVNDELGTLQVNTNTLIAVLINSVKELSRRIKELEG